MSKREECKLPVLVTSQHTQRSGTNPGSFHGEKRAQTKPASTAELTILSTAAAPRVEVLSGPDWKPYESG